MTFGPSRVASRRCNAIIRLIPVRTGHTAYRLGPFEPDPVRRTLNRGRETVFLPEKQVEVPVLLAARAGDIVSKAALAEAVSQAIGASPGSGGLRVSPPRRSLPGGPDARRRGLRRSPGPG
jgi:DNA-binding response OmpR family regulator